MPFLASDQKATDVLGGARHGVTTGDYDIMRTNDNDQANKDRDGESEEGDAENLTTTMANLSAQERDKLEQGQVLLGGMLGKVHTFLHSSGDCSADRSNLDGCHMCLTGVTPVHWYVRSWGHCC